MNRRRIVMAMNLGRAALGATMIARPAIAAGWVGERADDESVHVLTRGFGARDLALGVGTLLAMRDGRQARRWLTLVAFSDAVDLAAQIRGARAMPPFSAAIGIASAAVAAGSELLEAIAGRRPAKDDQVSAGGGT